MQDMALARHWAHVLGICCASRTCSSTCVAWVPAHPVNVLGLDVFIVGIIKYVGLERHSQESEDVVQFARHGLQKKVAAWRCNARKALLDGVALWIFRIHGEGDWP